MKEIGIFSPSKNVFEIIRRYTDKCYSIGITNLVHPYLSLICQLCLNEDYVDNALYPHVVKSIDNKCRELLSDNELSILKKEFSSVIEYIFSFLEYQNPLFGQYTEPFELTALCARLLSPEDSRSLYLPFAGLSRIATFPSNLQLYGEEFAPQIWLLAKIRHSVSQNKNSYFDLKQSNSFLRLSQDDEKFDYIYMNPPFGTHTVRNGERMDALYAIKKAVQNKLKQTGRMVVVLEMGSTFNRDQRWAEFREWIVENRFLKAIVSLPPIFRPHSNISSVLWVVEQSEKVTFVDGTSFKMTPNRKQCILNFPLLYDAICSGDSYCTITVNLKKIREESYILTPARYLFQNGFVEKTGTIYKPLGDLIEMAPKESTPYLERIISTVDLTRDYNSLSITPHEGSFRNGGYYTLADSYLISTLGGRIKVGRVSTHTPINKDILAFTPKKEVKGDYLIKELLSDYVEKQLQSYVYGNTIPRVSRSDLLRIKIAVPSIENQERIMKELLQKNLESTEEQLKKQFQAYKDETHMKKHAIGQDIMQLQTNWETLLQARDLNNGDLSDDIIIGKNHPLSVKEMINAISYYLKEVAVGIDNFTFAEGGQFRKKEVINAYLLIQDYCKNNVNPEFKIIYENHLSKSQKGEIFFSVDAMRIIIKNIIFNAWQHGFRERGKDNLIKIVVSEDDDFVFVEISNNGKLVDNSMLDGKLFEFGTSTKRGKNDGNGHSHSGLGCYQVRSLMIYENQGDIDLEQDPYNQFPVLFRLKFNKSKLPSHES